MGTDKMEAIGNVVLNYKYYSGEDLYSEGISEDLLLDYVTNNEEADYPHVIQNTRSWSVMYHLSNVRENICSWLPIKKTDRVLEIGAGCGAVTGCLARLAGHVTCIELSKKRSTINAVRHRELDNIEIIVGNFEDIEPELTGKYDYITLIGVLEYAGSYINSEDPYRDMLKRVRSHLTEGGKLVIAIENQLGLKYFAGCKEDHTGRFYEGIEGYPGTEGVRTFSRKKLKRLLEESGYASRFYYPYPDYKLPNVIYSDNWLPECSELNTNIRNFDADRMVTFDETKVFDTLINEDMFADFSNSFLVIATEDKIPDSEVFPVFAKYSSERSSEYRTATIIASDEPGRKKEVYKIALSPEANAHIDRIYLNYLALAKAFESTGFAPNVCRRIDEEDTGSVTEGFRDDTAGRIGLEFVNGITLENYLDDLEQEGKYERMLLLMKQYEAMICSISTETYENTDGFREVFGEYIDNDYKAPAVSDLDLIFTNIVFDRVKKENGEWTVLDYEWTYSFPIPAKFIIFRALFYYIQTHRKSAFMSYIKKRGINLYSEFKISQAEKDLFTRLEKHFQLHIIKGAPSLEVMHELMPVATVDAGRAAAREFKLKYLNNPEIYYSNDGIFVKDRQIYMFAETDDGHVSIDIPLSADMTFLRFDPTEYRCLLKLDSVILKDKAGNDQHLESFLTNGIVLPDMTILFDTMDPQLHFRALPGKEKTICLKYSVSTPDEELFKILKNLAVEREEHKKKQPVMIDKVLRRKKDGAQPVPEGLRKVTLLSISYEGNVNEHI